MTNEERAKEAVERFDPGHLNNFGGGNTAWWHEYIRLLLEEAHEHYNAATEGLREQLAQAQARQKETHNG